MDYCFLLFFLSSFFVETKGDVVVGGGRDVESTSISLFTREGVNTSMLEILNRGSWLNEFNFGFFFFFED